MPRSLILCTVTLALLTAGLCPAQDTNWPNWRGPNHDGISPEKGFSTKLDAPPPLAWSADIGAAFSAVVCVGDKLYTCGTLDESQVLFCVDSASGQILWKTPFEKAYPDGQGGDGTRGTPAVDDGRVYVQGAWGRVACFDAATGKELWHRDCTTPPRWGYSASVLIEQDLVLATAGEDAGALVALNKQTGQEVWKCGDGAVGYATPYPFTFEGQRYVVGFMAKQVLIAELKTGRVVWNMPWTTDWDVNAATPMFHDGYLFLSSGYKHGATLLKLARTGDTLTSQPVWENKNIRAKFQTPVLVNGYLYTSDEVGLKCVEFATGEEKWSQRGVKHGTVVAADNHLIVLTEDGRLLIAPATPKGWTPTTDVPLMDGRHWTVPTLLHGCLYVRNLEKLACYNLRGK